MSGVPSPVDPENQVAVFFPDAESENLLKMEEAAGDFLPLFDVTGFDVAPVVLRFFDFPVWIKK